MPGVKYVKNVTIYNVGLVGKHLGNVLSALNCKFGNLIIVCCRIAVND